MVFGRFNRAVIVTNGIGKPCRDWCRRVFLRRSHDLGSDFRAIVGTRLAAAVAGFARLCFVALGAILTVAPLLTVIAALVAIVAARGFLARLIVALVTVIAVVIAAIAIALLVVLMLLAFGLLALRLAQHAGVMLGVLQEGLFRHAVIRQLGIARQRQIFLDDLLRGAAHLALGTRRIKYTIDDIAERTLTVRLRTRTGFR